ncbi:UvrD-helicase domain-containing protein [Rhodospirillum centenum]|uniref:DNA 3'-5' helicase n=1 Tax=Rhodospirillum centenum (strain ATCC 51521 / SW) TaxID=414684 RepID=B6IP09_RHOCS|nr:UvrD-helicase domain-containing protein [Rhodospirillum centenum]ACI99429.1 UvrD [Rhodospirillum centenum SW]
MSDLFSDPPPTGRPASTAPSATTPASVPVPAAGAEPAYLAGLNPAQREAVEALDGPVLVLAGAGTGKTRVLTTRLAHLLVTRRAGPWNILTVTFTNKAAREMRERVEALVGVPTEGWWMGTFHALAARILRRHAELVGLKPSFTILDTDDQIRLLKQLMEAENIDSKKWPARVLLGAIERWKDKALTPDRLKREDAGDMAGGRLIDLYRQYQDRLLSLNACDFGDLLLHNIALFQKHNDVLREYQDRFRYILVDEYQDTNVAQYLWLRLLAQAHRNICCVGDDDQCLVAGTLIRMADGSERPIETVGAGDAVLSARGGGACGASVVSRTYARSYSGDLVTVELEDGTRLVSTPEHRHFAGYRLGVTPQLYFTYLMHKRGYGFRLGTSQTYTRARIEPVLGYELRCRQEHADAVWVLAVHGSENEARFLEYTLSLDYGIPTFPFVARKGGSTAGLVHDQSILDRLFKERPTETAGEAVLTRFGLSRDYPHYRPQAHTGRRRNVTVTLCGDNRAAAALHRISVIGSDPDDAAVLASLGLSIRPSKKSNPGWRYETAMADLGRIMATVEQIRRAFDGDVALVQFGRFGAGGEAGTDLDPGPAPDDGELLTAAPAPARVRSSLPMIPAGSVRPGMAMFRADGGLAIVRSVRTEPGVATVHDIDVSRTHNFIANGIITHNSIYGWRGAEVGNILRFDHDFTGARVIRLEQNYRSTAHILGAAHGIIANNQGRLGKQLWTEVDGGEKVRVRGLWDAEEEARWVGDEIEALQRKGLSLGQMAVLVRAGFQTREFEERFITLGLPYRVIGGPRFYERQEIRDALAYLRIVAQPDDDLAFERIINVPKRGIGDATLRQLYVAARTLGVSLAEATWRLTETDELRGKVRSTLRALMEDIARWRGQIDRTPHTDLAQAILDESGYTRMWQQDKSPEAPGRLENLKELINAMGEFENLTGFLEHVALVMDNAEASGLEQVSLMTLHGAKGLEFDVVFLPGWEEGLFPSQRTLDENGIAGLEEERRLAYVGITRGRIRVHVSHAANRRIHGSWATSLPSRFVDELPAEHVEVENAPGIGGAGFGSGGFGSGGFGGASAGGGWSGFGDRFNRMGRQAAQAPARGRVIEGTACQVAPRSRPDRPFNPGSRVFHQKFGYGTVVAVENDKLEIKFDATGVKKVMDSFVVPAEQAG